MMSYTRKIHPNLSIDPPEVCMKDKLLTLIWMMFDLDFVHIG